MGWQRQRAWMLVFSSAQITKSFGHIAALDHHQVRTWTSWHRWSLLAHAVLAVLAATQDPPPAGLIRLTRHEIRRLLVDLTRSLHPPEHILAWSIWRRDHQTSAQASHHRRTAAVLTA